MKKQTILVTGGAGYCGSHLCHVLVKSGYKVIVFDDLSNGSLKNLPGQAKFIRGDITKGGRFGQLFKKEHIDAVVHLAAKISVSESNLQPTEYFETNVVGTLNVLKMMRKYKVKNFIFASTSAVYSNSPDKKYEYTSEIDPQSVYAETKWIAENLIKRFCTQYNINNVIFRFFNVAGTSFSLRPDYNTNQKSIIPAAVAAWYWKKPLTIYGDGGAVRDFISVLDVVTAIKLALKKMEKIGKLKTTYSLLSNLGSKKGRSVSYILQKIANFTVDSLNITYKPKRSEECEYSVSGNNFAKYDLNWKPVHSGLDEIIQSVLNSYK